MESVTIHNWKGFETSHQRMKLFLVFRNLLLLALPGEQRQRWDFQTRSAGKMFGPVSMVTMMMSLEPAAGRDSWLRVVEELSYIVA